MCLTFRLQITLLGRPMHQLLAGYHEAGKMGTRCFCFGSRLVLSVSKTMAKCSIYSWVVETVPRETQGKSVAFVWIFSQCSQCSFCAIAQLHFDLFELDSSLFTFLIKQWSEKLRFLILSYMICLIQGIQPTAFSSPLAALPHQGHSCHHLHHQINTTTD